ncbi:hypothetical protein Pelo_12860 [Pelomyxa schiedti]|nr:hypothetical protein Pelo_12860 [Pelomyxa schiedti]
MSQTVTRSTATSILTPRSGGFACLSCGSAEGNGQRCTGGKTKIRVDTVLRKAAGGDVGSWRMLDELCDSEPNCIELVNQGLCNACKLSQNGFIGGVFTLSVLRKLCSFSTTRNQVVSLELLRNILLMTERWGFKIPPTSSVAPFPPDLGQAAAFIAMECCLFLLFILLTVLKDQSLPFLNLETLSILALNHLTHKRKEISTHAVHLAYAITGHSNGASKLVQNSSPEFWLSLVTMLRESSPAAHPILCLFVSGMDDATYGKDVRQVLLKAEALDAAVPFIEQGDDSALAFYFAMVNDPKDGFHKVSEPLLKATAHLIENGPPETCARAEGCLSLLTWKLLKDRRLQKKLVACHAKEILSPLRKVSPYVSLVLLKLEHGLQIDMVRGATMRFCSRPNCTATTPMKRCSACKIATYCGKECQKLDWQHHKLICKRLPAAQKIERARNLACGFIKEHHKEALKSIHAAGTNGIVTLDLDRSPFFRVWDNTNIDTWLAGAEVVEMSLEGWNKPYMLVCRAQMITFKFTQPKNEASSKGGGAGQPVSKPYNRWPLICEYCCIVVLLLALWLFIRRAIPFIF